MVTVTDTADVLFGLAILIYGYVLCLDAYSTFGANKRLPKWVEPWFLIIMGLIILFSSFSELMGCNHAGCMDSTAVTLFFGILLIALGIVAFLNNSLEVFSFSVSWVMPCLFLALGILFRSPSPSSSSSSSSSPKPSHGHGHSHRSLSSSNNMDEMTHDFSAFMEQAFTVCSLSSALLRALMHVDPQRWGVFTAYALSLTSFSLIAQSSTLDSYLTIHFMPHTVFLGLCVIAAILLVPLLFVIYSFTKGEIEGDNNNYKHGEKDMKGT